MSKFRKKHRASNTAKYNGSTTPGRTGLAVFVFAPLGFLMIAFAVEGLWQSEQRSRWPTTPGRMERTQIIRSVGARSSYRFRPDIAYTYSIGGQVLQGDRLSLDKPGENSQNALEQRLAPFPPGATVAVYYNPAAPTESVLEVGNFDWDDGVLLVIGLATLAGSIMVYLTTARRQKK